jgi:peptidyl-prolyl cis-trans isomerase D
MALINKIREKTGLVVTVVAFGLILFLVGGDVLSPNSVLLSGRTNNVGEIAGENVALQEYQRRVDEMKENFYLNTGRNPSDAELNGLRQQAWDLLISQIAFGKQYEELGLKVTQEEIIDMVQGKNISPELRQAFTNPETGEFDRNQIVSFLKNIDQMPPQNQTAWFAFERNLGPGRIRVKYDNLLIKSDYVTTAEAIREYQAQNEVAEVRYLYIPFYSVPESEVQVSDDQLRSYIKKNSQRYKTEALRGFDYVSFSVVSSADDTAAIKTELAKLKEEFRTVQDDSLFARIHSESGEFFNRYNPGELPEVLKANIGNLTEGDVRGPYLENGAYVLYKISEIYDDTVASARASHILFSADRTDAEARAKAKRQSEDILKEIQRGADFEEMARQHSADPTSRRGGDLGWFSTGRMVKPFEDAVFQQRNGGLVNKVVETDYGYHIIKVTEAPTRQTYAVASIDREITASDETRNEAFRKADYFAASVGNAKQFKEFAEKEGYSIETVENVRTSDRRVGNVGEARELIRWSFTDASIGKVSNVFELDDDYVVAVLTKEVEEGTAPLNIVRDEVSAKVRNEQIAKKIIDNLKGKTGSLEEIANSYGEDAKVYSTSDLRFTTNTLPNVGFAPVAVGKAFGLAEGKRTEPFQDENGVLIVEVVNKTEAPEIADYSSYKNQVQQRVNSRTAYNLTEAVKKQSEIKDNRYKFF